MGPKPAQADTDAAIKILSDRHFHRCLWLPATNTHGRLRVTYALTTNFEDASLPVLLWIGPMFCSRYHVLFVEKLAKDYGIRAICTDRPSMGGSTPVDLSKRVEIWLETVPALLQAVNVQYVSIATHSAGTTYTLNTIHRFPEILHPKAPYVAFMAPWVHNEHSNASLMNLVSKLPKGAIGSLDSIQRFVMTNVNPTIGWSGGVISSISSLFQAQSGNADAGETDESERYGLTPPVASELTRLMSKYQLAEPTAGVSEDALHCMKRGGVGSWGVCDDYEEYVRSLCGRQSERRSADEGAQVKLKVKAFFAASDIMIGQGGQEYFEKCWRQPCVPDQVDFVSRVLPDTNHETIIVDHKKGALQSIFEDVKKNHESS